MSKKSIRVGATLTQAESDRLDQIAALTGTGRNDVIRDALAVYAWFVRQAVTGARVTARAQTGEEITLVTPELVALEVGRARCSPEELGALGEELARAAVPAEATQLRERLTRGFYGF